MQADRLYLVGLSTTQRNSGLRESLLKGGRDRKGNGAERQWVAGSGGGGGLEGGLEDFVDAVEGADFG